jgi:hypothetical protein
MPALPYRDSSQSLNCIQPLCVQEPRRPESALVSASLRRCANSSLGETSTRSPSETSSASGRQPWRHVSPLRKQSDFFNTAYEASEREGILRVTPIAQQEPQATVALLSTSSSRAALPRFARAPAAASSTGSACGRAAPCPAGSLAGYRRTTRNRSHQPASKPASTPHMPLAQTPRKRKLASLVLRLDLGRAAARSRTIRLSLSDVRHRAAAFCRALGCWFATRLLHKPEALCRHHKPHGGEQTRPHGRPSDGRGWRSATDLARKSGDGLDAPHNQFLARQLCATASHGCGSRVDSLVVTGPGSARFARSARPEQFSSTRAGG